ncbi:MAG: PDZ domain-containing protein [Chthoniobacter sp.]
MFAALLAALTLATPDPGFGIVPVSLPSTDKPPLVRQGMPRTGDATPAPRKRVFVLGIQFQSRGGAQGIALERVVPGSPADRAGFTVGTIITEIDGKSTAGRTGEDCRRIVQEAGTTVPIKYYDPLTFKLRARTVDKDWIPDPTN